MVAILLFLVPFSFGIAGLRSGEIRSRGRKPSEMKLAGYRITVLAYVGPRPSSA